MKPIKALIIDDESLARDLIKNYLLDYLFIELVGECSDGFQGIKAIQELQPDLIFLDIQMPKLTGFELLELVEKPPIVIFTTAYNEYAIKAFEMNAIDYLLKPFSRERFNKSMNKVNHRIETKEIDSKNLTIVTNLILENEKTERIVIKTGIKIHVIPVNTIHYIEAQDDYVMIYTAEGKYLKQQTMKHYEASLDSSCFIRIHRSYIVNSNEIEKIEPYEKGSYKVILKNKSTIPVSKRGYVVLKKFLKL